MKKLIFIFAIFLPLQFSLQSAIAGFNPFAQQPEERSVTLQLKWQHQFQFAGYYMAQAKGFYKNRGLKVNLIEATPDSNAIESVLMGRADFGVSNSELLLEYAKGQPIVALGVIFQHSPLAIVTLKRPELSIITDLQGKKIMIEEDSSEIAAFLQKSGLTPSDYQPIHHNFSLQPLLSNKIDASTVYTTTETYELSRAGIDYQLFSPRMAGIDFYGDNFFTSQSLLNNDPELVANFRQASLEGWLYAMQHIDETIDYIVSTYPNHRSRDALQFEAEQMQKLMRTDLIQPGHMNQHRWQHIASVYHDIGLLEQIPNLDNFIYSDKFALDTYAAELKYLLAFLFGTLLVMIFSGYLARRFFRLQTQLATMIDQSPMAVVLLDDQLKVVEWNHQAEKTFGWRANQIIKHNILDFLVIEAHKPRLKQHFAAIIADQKPIQIEYKNYTITGQEISCHWSNAPFHINGEKFIICMALDISELRNLKALALEKAPCDISPDIDENQQFLERLVKTMQLSLQIWEESTSKSKVQFAEQSGLWRVSLDGSTAKTRTLDKYLSLSLIPQKPRWKQVINSANFIIREFPDHPKIAVLNQYKETIRKPED